MDKPQALVGMHDAFKSSLDTLLRSEGYGVTLVDSVAEMLERLNSSGPYRLCFMDANLGSPSEETYEPARRVYEIITSRSEKMGFMAFTGSPTLVNTMRTAGFPGSNKTSAPFAL